MKRILPHQWLKPSSLSVSKELLDSRQNTKHPLVPWGQNDHDQGVIFLGPNRTILIERELELLPCSTDAEAKRAFAWLTVALSAGSQNPLVLSVKRFPLEYDHAYAAWRKPEFKDVREGLDMILQQLGFTPGTFELYNPDEPKEDGEVVEDKVEVLGPVQERHVVRVDQEQEDEPDVEEIEREALSLGSSFSLYDEEEGDRDKGAEGEQAEKGNMKDLVKLFQSALLAMIASTSQMVGKDLQRQRDKQEQVEKEDKADHQEKKFEIISQEVQSIAAVLNNVVQKIVSLTEKIKLYGCCPRYETARRPPNGPGSCYLLGQTRGRNLAKRELKLQRNRIM